MNEPKTIGPFLHVLKECSQQITPSLCSLFNLSLQSSFIPSEWKSADVTPIHKRDSNERAENYRPIPARLLKECSQQITPSLCSLFNLSLQSSFIPSEWKSADVTPIHKRDSNERAENYRPIPARLLKECRQQITPSLCSLFNLSLQSSFIPSEWKSADVTPIHKRDSNERAENYRPIPARLVKECRQQFTPSLCSLFNLSLQSSFIPSEWKSADVTPIHKRDSNERAENYGTSLFNLVLFRPSGNQQTSHQYIKEILRKKPKTIGLYIYCQSSAKPWNVVCTLNSMTTFNFLLAKLNMVFFANARV